MNGPHATKIYRTADRSMRHKSQAHKANKTFQCHQVDNQEYNHEVDMYGDIRKAGDVAHLPVMEFGIPIPQTFLADESNMKTVRGLFRFN